MKIRSLIAAKVSAGTMVGGLMLAGCIRAGAQALPAAPAASPACVTTATKACPAAPDGPQKQKSVTSFPYPGENPSAGDRPGDVAPDAPTAGRGKPTVAPPPYPGDPDAPAGTQTKPRVAPPAYPGDPDAPAAGSAPDSSSSSSSAFNPDADDAGPLKDAGSSGEDTKVVTPMRRRRMPKAKPETPESRAAEDLTVAEFYTNDGNYAAAYLRAKDAVENQPNDPYTHFALAEAARKLGKRDEAKMHYEQVLKLDPIPKQLKATQRALAELNASAAR